VEARVNLADVYRARGAESEAESVLRQGIANTPRAAALHYALGLTLVREKRPADGLREFGEAAKLAPENARYAYVYAIALNSTGSAAAATALLERTHQQHPTDRDVLLALFSIARDKGDRAAALGYARALSQLSPTDIQLRLLIRQLEQSGTP
jgi:Flp pilus assembly protein TadD